MIYLCYPLSPLTPTPPHTGPLPVPAYAGVPADAAPTGGLPAVVPPGAAMPTPTPSERRRVTRLDIFVNFVVRRVGTLGTVLQEERTIAENVGRGGARVVHRDGVRGRGQG